MTAAALEASELHRHVPASDEELPPFRPGKTIWEIPRRVLVSQCRCGLYFNPVEQGDELCLKCAASSDIPSAFELRQRRNRHRALKRSRRVRCGG